MKRTILAAAVALAIAAPTAAQASDERTYTYMCRVGRNTYPVAATITDDLQSGTLTWRGKTFPNAKLTGYCRYEWTATSSDGVTATLCTATKGVAGLTIGSTTFECQMKTKYLPRLPSILISDPAAPTPNLIIGGAGDEAVKAASKLSKPLGRGQ